MRLAPSFLCCLAAVVLLAGASVPAQPDNGPAALQLHDRYLAAWNARDAEAFAATLHYPHARQAPGAPGSSSWQGAEEYAAGMDFGPLVARGWVRSHWDARTVVQAGSNKVHVAARARRVDAAGRAIETPADALRDHGTRRTLGRPGAVLGRFRRLPARLRRPAGARPWMRSKRIWTR